MASRIDALGSSLRVVEHVVQKDSDVGLATWFLSADIPEFRDITREEYLQQVASLVNQVRLTCSADQTNDIRRGDQPDAFARCARFCTGIIKLGFVYREEFRQEDLAPAQMKALYHDPDNLFLPGLLRTKRGSCVSLPMIYLIIGRHLGLPVHLVTIGKHYFIRWEEPGFRMNIEPTIVDRVAVTPDDSVYLEAEGITRDQLRGSQMRNLTDREVLGELFYTRAAYWATKGPHFKRRQQQDLQRARELAPDDPEIQATYDAVFKSQQAKIKSNTKPVPNK